ncbi:MAG TPA: phBC6A51 family helix-turn-helix protein [Candidatus Woesebacteria bacterium]|mgnify:CR=1 FL=1|nr:phBC6A51 family helix-turn-helix protein [Candidatus Woesebacteria bacterium]
MGDTITERQGSNKQLVIEQLKKIPIIQIVCEKVGIGRATYYRWRKEDKIFKKETDQAIQEGKFFINDLAESQLLSAIKNGNMTGIIYWLKHHHPDYTNKLEITTKQLEDEKLSPEQEELIRNALQILHKNNEKLEG